MCTENISLAVTAEGLGRQISIFREEQKFAVEKLLNIPEEYELTTILLIGEIDEDPGEKRNGIGWIIVGCIKIHSVILVNQENHHTATGVIKTTIYDKKRSIKNATGCIFT